MSKTRDAATERNSYTHQAQDEVRVWEQKLHDFDAEVQVKATDAKASTSKDIDDAWAQTKTAFAGLETAGEKDWDSEGLLQNSIRQTCSDLEESQSCGQIVDIFR
jgi:hypothetical protein